MFFYGIKDFSWRCNCLTNIFNQRIIKMKSSVLLACLAAIVLSACTQRKTENQQPLATESTSHTALHTDTVHTSQNSLDWAGEYVATIPCADCEGIKTHITLKNDDTFSIVSEYINKNSKVVDSGKMMWHDQGSVIHLTGKETNMKLKVGEGRLIGLDLEGKEIEGPNAHLYVYNKVEGEK
jgi:uncharacterized lipoprotein NlpE involved in copper resistance